jgi:F-type H+-transporting ATPase subunit c
MITLVAQAEVAANYFSVLEAYGFAYPLGLALAAFGVALGLGMLLKAAMESMGRQPEAIPQIQIAMIIGAAFVEALAIYMLISPFLAGAAKLIPAAS